MTVIVHTVGVDEADDDDDDVDEDDVDAIEVDEADDDVKVLKYKINSIFSCLLFLLGC